MATESREWRVLTELFKKDEGKIVSAPHVQRAWLAAAAARRDDVLTLINTYRPETLTLTYAEWDSVYRLVKAEWPQHPIIALLESTYPGHAKTAREAPPVEETRFKMRRFLADRLPQGLTNFFSWIGGRLSKIWEKLTCCWTRR